MKNYPTQIANFAVTYRCDSQCRNCNIWQKQPENELTLSEITEFFTSNRENLRKVKSIQLTGGEPFLRDDLPEIADVISEQIPRCMIWIPTNGMNPEKIKHMTQQMLADGVKLGVSISLDGISNVHDHHRGVPGSYKLARNTLTSLMSVRKTQPRLKLSLGFTLTPHNIREAPIVQRIAYNVGADFSFRLVNKSSFYYSNQDPDTVNPDELDEVLRSISYNLVNHKGKLGSSTMLQYIEGVKEYVGTGRVMPCEACSDSFYLDPTGNIYPCIMMNRVLGNIREDDFETIWESEAAIDARKTISKLECPTCWVECEAFREISKQKGKLAWTLFKTMLNLNRF